MRPASSAHGERPGESQISTQRSRAPQVAVVTVSYRSGAVLPALLDSLSTASTSPVTVVIADNAREAEIAEVAAQRGIRYVPLENRGYGSAVNAVAAELPHDIEWILVANPDVTFRPGAIDALVREASADAAVGSAGPRILDAQGEVYPSARTVPSLRTGVGHAVAGKVWPGNPWTRSYLRLGELSGDVPRDAGWLSGACLLIRRDAFEAVGGFDEGFFMYFEDVDLGYRLGRRGYVNRYVPAAAVIHTGAHSTSQESARMIEAHHESASRFLAKRYPGAVFAPVRLVLRIGLAIRSRRATASQAGAATNPSR